MARLTMVGAVRIVDGMSVAAHADRPLQGAELEAAREALLARVVKFDLDALAEWFSLSGGTCTWVGEPVLERGR